MTTAVATDTPLTNFNDLPVNVMSVIMDKMLDLKKSNTPQTIKPSLCKLSHDFKSLQSVNKGLRNAMKSP